jgi:hypothetical protein
VRKNFSPIGDIAERLSGDPCAPEKICTPQEFASLSMGSNRSALARKKNWPGAEGFENEPLNSQTLSEIAKFQRSPWFTTPHALRERKRL